MRTGRHISESISLSAPDNDKEDGKLNCIIALLAGVCLGIPLGWALLFWLVMLGDKSGKQPTKDEWKVM
jgi:hypothetical protein